jgi:hypothetical protein
MEQAFVTVADALGLSFAASVTPPRITPIHLRARDPDWILTLLVVGETRLSGAGAADASRSAFERSA